MMFLVFLAFDIFGLGVCFGIAIMYYPLSQWQRASNLWRRAAEAAAEVASKWEMIAAMEGARAKEWERLARRDVDVDAAIDAPTERAKLQ